MGAALYIVAERKVPGLDTLVNGKWLGRCNNLDRLAERSGVRPLMEFFSISPVEAAAAMEDLGGEMPEGGLPAEEWFPADAGLTTVRGLLGHLAQHPDAITSPKGVVLDLREFEAVLTRLEAEGVRWHLAVDY